MRFLFSIPRRERPPASTPDANAVGINGWRGGILFAVAALTIWFYSMAMTSFSTLSDGRTAGAYYNLLVDGFTAGQLSLKLEPEPAFAALPDPYDPVANEAFREMHPGGKRVHDLSYYRGRFYLYFGVTPALILFWPFKILTGHPLSHPDAVLIFVSLGFLASSAWLLLCWRRYFREVRFAAVVGGVLSLGFLTSVLLLLQRPEVWEVTVSCAYALIALSLLFLWPALHAPRYRAAWLAAASLAYGLVVGARPSALPGAVILLVPVIHSWMTADSPSRRWPGIGRLLVAALVPIGMIGLGLALYNHLRFGSPFEFGQTYQLAGDRQDTADHFSLRYFWFNFRIYFLAPAQWGSSFPFVGQITASPLPPGHGAIEPPWGLLTNMPFLCLALAAPLTWWHRSSDARLRVKFLMLAVAGVLVSSAVTMCLFYGVTIRYQLEFSPFLALLAGIGVLGLERAAAMSLRWRRVIRAGWLALLGVSLAFSVLVAAMLHAVMLSYQGQRLHATGAQSEAIAILESALRFKPDLMEARDALIQALCVTGRFDQVQDQLEYVLKTERSTGAAYSIWLANELLSIRQLEPALTVLAAAARHFPDSAVLHNNLGFVLRNAGREDQAIAEFQRALQLDPQNADAACNLGAGLAQQRRLEEAARLFEQALRANPQHIAAHFFLGNVSMELGRWADAETHYEQALRLDPNLSAARDMLDQLKTIRATER